jgi:hypothetical protein
MLVGVARHRLQNSADLITALGDLGVALGYHASEEHVVTKSGGAVDVAWLRSRNDRAPLFIFEVESQASSSAANNPLKVYGQRNEELPKPLFFFHVFLSRSDRSERIDLLRTQYGTQNYRVYRLGAGDSTTLIHDVLEQHRRLTHRVDLLPVIQALAHEALAACDLDSILLDIERLGFTACYVPDYTRLSLMDDQFRSHLARQLMDEEIYENPAEDGCWYQSYLGYHCAAPLHLAIVARLGTAPETTMLERLRQWQGERSDRRVPAAVHGLSREFDDFVIGWSPPLWTLVGALFSSAEARRFCSGELRTVVENCSTLREDGEALVPALWGLWLAAAAEACDDYQVAAALVTTRGGVNSEYLAAPPSCISFDERDDPWWSELHHSPVMPPDMSEFRRRYLRGRPGDVVALALEALLDNETVFRWGPRITAALRTNC